MSSFMDDPIVSETHNTREPAILGTSYTKRGIGVSGHSTLGYGVYGESEQLDGILGISKSSGHAGVSGVNVEGVGNGVYGHSKQSDGVIGITEGDGKAGVAGVGETGNCNGVYGRSKNANGVVGYSSSDVHAGVAGVSDNSAGVGVYGKGGRVAGYFEGNVEVTGDICLVNADCAEDFNISEAALVEPGTVMVLGETDALLPSQKAYDKRVAGVISGAGDFKPGIVLDKQQSRARRLPVALLGKVFCKVDAQYGAIAVGDLLTTSPTSGHAMKADDPHKAFGAVIGKALRPLAEGQGLIPILVTLQ